MKKQFTAFMLFLLALVLFGCATTGTLPSTSIEAEQRSDAKWVRHTAQADFSLVTYDELYDAAKYGLEKNLFHLMKEDKPNGVVFGYHPATFYEFYVNGAVYMINKGDSYQVIVATDSTRLNWADSIIKTIKDYLNKNRASEKQT